ncbi:hypothetical protein J4439_02530 [Candidatus Woesearchaeota archaeon]|nr:hypothetical protein [Candidatus Woesearchaeota archaeon]
MTPRVLPVMMAVLAAVLLVPGAGGVGIGLSPGSLSFENVLRDGYAEGTFVVTSSMSESVPIYGRVQGDVGEWLHFPDATEGLLGEVSVEHPLIVRVAVAPPGDVASGRYSGYVLLETGTLASVGDTIGSAVRVSLLGWTHLSVTGEEIRDCQVGALQLTDTEPGMPLELSLMVRNTGNVRLAPEVQVDIWDQGETTLLTGAEEHMETVLPTTKREQRFYLDHGLPQGQYWALVSVPECGSSQLLTFDVLPLGGVADRGQLESVTSEVWARVGDLVPVRAVFSNTGQRSVRAIFRGSVVSEGRTIELLQSEEALVPPGESAELLSYFRPQRTGQYELRGRVHYNGKLTYEKGTILNVNAGPAARIPGRLVAAYGLLLAMLALLVLFIRKKRRRG